jgi:hypothetical protein
MSMVTEFRIWRAMRALDRQKRTLQDLSRMVGVCAASSDQGYLCTVEGPHLRHRAVTEDGRLLCEWVDDADMAP